ncbi:MAG: acyltransferase [Eubacteriales bacterium]|nr:acyltransferase [Eubacteriales bacterium]
MMQGSDEALYRKINVLRFLLICCVLQAHSENYPQFGLLSGTGCSIEQHVLASMEWVVSMYYMLSSFLFFRGFQWNQLLGKWKRRIFTLVIPYIIWNTVYFGFFALLPRIPFFAQFINSEPAPLTVSNVLFGVLLNRYAGFLWFVKTLIIFILCAPLFYVLFSKKYIAEFSLIALFLFLFRNPFQFPAVLNLHWRFIFFFSVGAYFGLRAPHVAYYTPPRAVRYVLLCAIPLYAYHHTLYTTEMYSVLVILSLWLGIDGSAIRERSWYNTSFFVYLTHFLALSILKKIQYALVPHTELWMLISYFSVTIIALCLLVPLAQLLRRYTPKTYAILFGGR